MFLWLVSWAAVVGEIVFLVLSLGELEYKIATDGGEIVSLSWLCFCAMQLQDCTI